MPEPLAISAVVIARIRDRRRRLGISAQQLADGLGARGIHFTRNTISNAENGKRQALPIDVVVGAAEILGVAVTYLIGDGWCARCDGTPPLGFTCNACGATTKETEIP